MPKSHTVRGFNDSVRFENFCLNLLHCTEQYFLEGSKPFLHSVLDTTSRIAWKTQQQEQTRAAEMGGLCEGSKISKPLPPGHSRATQPRVDASQQPFPLEGLWI